MKKSYLRKSISTLNNLHMWILLADVYYQIEISEDEEHILAQLEIAEMLEIELKRRKRNVS